MTELTYADSLLRVIEQRKQELRALEGRLRAAQSHPGSHEWDAREVLLHLIGATQGMPDDLRGAAPGVAPRQPGGRYIERPELASALDASALLLEQLDAIADAVRVLDDDALSRRVTLSDGDGNPLPDVPIGLVVRHGLTEHFDEHLTQVRAALASGGAG